MTCGTQGGLVSGQKQSMKSVSNNEWREVSRSHSKPVVANAVRTIKDGRVISLIHKYLNAGAIANGMFERTEIGMPQGGPLSPILSNIMLNELDKELERRGHRFVRYADDCAPRKRVQVT